jgi:hypothetical protein
VVFAPGTYAENVEIFVDSTRTPAPALNIHGGSATLTGSLSEIALEIALPTAVRDLKVVYASGTAISVDASSVVLERLDIQARVGVQATTPLTIRDVSVQTTGTGIGIRLATGAALTLDRVILSGGLNGIVAANMTTVDMSNLLVFSTSGVAVDLSTASGSISFVTITDSGTGTGVAGLICSAVAVRSSIVWTPSGTSISAGCTNLVSTIAGPIGVGGAMNVDPLFVSSAGHDYHLGANSPARDQVDAGPMFDFEGDPRPSGPRFDIGADEATP